MRTLLILAALISLSFAQVNIDCSNVRCASPPVGCQPDKKTCCGYVCPTKCQTDDQCAEGSFCKKDSCSQTATGACTKIPQFCTRNYSPVCGCNGKTFSNECVAHTSGVSVKSAGECPTKPVGLDCSTVRCAPIPDGCRPKIGMCCDYVCLGKCQTNSECGKGSFCSKDSCDLGATGTCTKTSLICPALFKPVCGCDGETYTNECKARSKGISIKSAGKCPTKPIGLDCSTVRCAPIPDGCRPKIGTCCDFVCPGKCQTDSQCGEGSFCNKDSCDLAATGVCEKTGNVCPKIYQPVCGCDGKTYGNKCSAHSSRMIVQSAGECPTQTVPSKATFGASLADSDLSPDSSLNNTDTPAYAIVLLVIGSLLLVSLIALILMIIAVARKNVERA